MSNGVNLLAAYTPPQPCDSAVLACSQLSSADTPMRLFAPLNVPTLLTSSCDWGNHLYKCLQDIAGNESATRALRHRHVTWLSCEMSLHFIQNRSQLCTCMLHLISTRLTAPTIHTSCHWRQASRFEGCALIPVLEDYIKWLASHITMNRIFPAFKCN